MALNLKEILLRSGLWADCEIHFLAMVLFSPLPISHVCFSGKLGETQQAKYFSKWEAQSNILLVTCWTDSTLSQYCWGTNTEQMVPKIHAEFIFKTFHLEENDFSPAGNFYYLNKTTLCTSIRLCTKIKVFFPSLAAGNHFNAVICWTLG